MAKHVALLDQKLTALAQKRIRRLIVALPPRHTKTTLAGRIFPPWIHGCWPNYNIMYFTATDVMAQRAGKAAREIASQALPTYFGRRLDPNYRAWWQWKVEGSPPDHGECLFSSIGGGRTMGAGADVIVVDDYFRNVQDALSLVRRKSQEEWFLTSALTRLTPDGVVLLMATRWHREDLIGIAERSQEFTGEKWEVVSLPALAGENDLLGRAPGEALWPQRWPAETHERTRKRLSGRGYPWMFEALYQQDPPSVLDAEWPAEYFGSHIWCDEIPRTGVLARVVSIDPSKGKTSKSDYSALVAATLTGDGTIWIDSRIERMDLTQISANGASFLAEHRPDEFVVETNQFQELLCVTFEAECRKLNVNVPIIGVDHNASTGEKRVRIRRLTPLLAAGKIRFKRGSPGNALLVEQLQGFPAHANDDGPDALEMAIRRLDDCVTGGVPDYYQSSPGKVPDENRTT